MSEINQITTPPSNSCLQENNEDDYSTELIPRQIPTPFSTSLHPNAVDSSDKLEGPSSQFDTLLIGETEPKKLEYSSAKSAVYENSTVQRLVPKDDNELSLENSTLIQKIEKLESDVRAREMQISLLEHEVQRSTLHCEAMQDSLNASEAENQRLCKEFYETRLNVGIESSSNHGLVDLLRDENVHLHEQIRQTENDLHCRVSQVASLEQENAQILYQSQTLEHALETSRIENRRLIQELDASRRNVDTTSHKTMELQQMAAKTKYDAAAYQEMITDLNNERISMMQTLNDQRDVIQELNVSVATSQTRQSVASHQIRKLVHEKAQLVTKLNEANARLEHSYTRVGMAGMAIQDKSQNGDNNGGKSESTPQHKVLTQQFHEMLLGEE